MPALSQFEISSTLTFCRADIPVPICLAESIRRRGVKVYAFSGPDGWNGLTKDESGDNLPPERGPWRRSLTGVIDVNLTEIDPRKETMLGDLKRQGFHVTPTPITVFGPFV